MKIGEKVKENATGTSRNQMTFGRAIKRASVFAVAEILKDFKIYYEKVFVNHLAEE